MQSPVLLRLGQAGVPYLTGDRRPRPQRSHKAWTERPGHRESLLPAHKHALQLHNRMKLNEKTCAAEPCCCVRNL